MPGVNFEGSDMQNTFMDYVVLRGSNMAGAVHVKCRLPIACESAWFQPLELMT
jgi:hypothetical protein